MEKVAKAEAQKEKHRQRMADIAAAVERKVINSWEKKKNPEIESRIGVNILYKLQKKLSWRIKRL